MASDVYSRLSRLRSRRKGESTISTFDSVYGSVNENLTINSQETEDWERRGSQSQQWTKYAIGAMQSVGKKYTAISIETGERVAHQLKERLTNSGINIECRLQGSVPLDVHIKSVSDVDVLILRTDFLTYEPAGVKSLRGEYRNPTKLTSSGVLHFLRQQVESQLDNSFPAASVNKTGAKAVTVRGGSLPRSVDVIPSHWHDTSDYQMSGKQADRGVTIYNKITGETIGNLPFLHIERVGNRCNSINGGLRKAIRLCKSVKADSDRDIKLSSYDIAAIMYHSDMSALRLGQYSDITILTETQRHLDALYQDPVGASKLWVPDGSRVIFDTEEKRKSLLQLSVELDELLKNVYRENFAHYSSTDPSYSRQRDLVKALNV